MNLPDALLAAVKEHARGSGRTVTSVVEQALLDLLERARDDRANDDMEPFELPSYGQAGGVILVDLSDNEAVRGVLDDCA